MLQHCHDKETCARRLRAAQESRLSMGSFPPGAPISPDPPHQLDARCTFGNSQAARNNNSRAQNRPASLDVIGTSPTSSIQSSTHYCPANEIFRQLGHESAQPKSTAFQLNVNVACSPNRAANTQGESSL